MSKDDTQHAIVPRLRFPEFRDAPRWDVKRLGSRGEFLSSLIGKSAADFDTGDANFIPYMNVFSNTFTDIHDLRSVSVGKDENQNAVAKGDVFFTVSSETPEDAGMSSVLLDDIDDCYLNSFCTLFRFQDERSPNPVFLGHMLRSAVVRKHLARGAQGATRYNISKSVFRDVPLLLPDPAEQRKIASCLGSLDDLIVAEGRKLAALRDHKQGLMQQLFPRSEQIENGVKVPAEIQPRLRFPEFQSTGRWDWKPLGEFADIKLGKMLDKNKHRSGHRLPYLNNLAVRWNDFDTSGLPEMYFDDDELEKYELTAGDVVVCEGGEPGRSAVWDERLPDMKFQKALHRVRFRIEFVPHLLVHYLETIAGTEAFESLFTGGGIKHLTRQTFALLAVPIASPAEQSRIADCLSALDARISGQAAKLDALRAHKRGLMQQLFPTPEGHQ